MSVGITLIAKEREEQINKHGRTTELDILNNYEYQLTDAAQGLLPNYPESMKGAYIQAQESYPPVGWDAEAWKHIVNKPYLERLAVAGALIAAEIDRVLATETQPQNG